MKNKGRVKGCEIVPEPRIKVTESGSISLESKTPFKLKDLRELLHYADTHGFTDEANAMFLVLPTGFRSEYSLHVSETFNEEEFG